VCDGDQQSDCDGAEYKSTEGHVALSYSSPLRHKQPSVKMDVLFDELDRAGLAMFVV